VVSGEAHNLEDRTLDILGYKHRGTRLVTRRLRLRVRVRVRVRRVRRLWVRVRVRVRVRERRRLTFGVHGTEGVWMFPQQFAGSEAEHLQEEEAMVTASLLALEGGTISRGVNGTLLATYWLPAGYLLALWLYILASML
jgi:hypothetical protein